MTEPSPTTDETLRPSVLQALADDPGTAGLDLRVGVLHGVVHLAGWTPSAKSRRRAEAVCAGVPGVRGVVNRIQAPGAPDPARTIHIQPSGSRRGRP